MKAEAEKIPYEDKRNPSLWRLSKEHDGIVTLDYLNRPNYQVAMARKAYDELKQSWEK